MTVQIVLMKVPHCNFVSAELLKLYLHFYGTSKMKKQNVLLGLTPHRLQLLAQSNYRSLKAEYFV